MNSSAYRGLVSELDAGKKTIMVTIMNYEGSKGNSAINKILLTEWELYTPNYTYCLDKMIYQKAQYALESGNLQLVQGPGKESYLIEPYFPEPRLIVFGGGHIAKPLVEFGTRLGFIVTVVDDRPMFANRNRFPEAEDVICDSFDKCFTWLNLNESAFAVIVTRGHRHDLDCLRQILNYKTAYTGMIGSRRRVKIVKEQLLGEGYSVEQLNRVNAPIGLEIGAVTPEEIAVSILAQVISYRRLAGSAAGSTASLKVNWPELDRAVLVDLCKEGDDPRAVVTIVATKGSVPRKAGAKMIVWPHGRTLGSIGGGCSEGEAVITARDVIRSGGYRIQNIDMTGQIAEEEGMACGGAMEVIIESYS